MVGKFYFEICAGSNGILKQITHLAGAWHILQKRRIAGKQAARKEEGEAYGANVLGGHKGISCGYW